MTDGEKKVSCKGFNFSLKPYVNKDSKSLLRFELLFQDIKREDSCNEDMPLIKARLLDKTLTSYQNLFSDQNTPEKLNPCEFKFLKPLTKSKDIATQKADKGNTVVILDQCSYISAIEEIFNDNAKLDIPAGKDMEINHIINLQKIIALELKLLKNDFLHFRQNFDILKT